MDLRQSGGAVHGLVSAIFDYTQHRLGNPPALSQHPDMAKPALDLTTLTPDEKLELIDDLWGSIHPEDLVLTPDQRDELDRRLARIDREGVRGTAWDVVRSKMSRG